MTYKKRIHRIETHHINDSLTMHLKKHEERIKEIYCQLFDVPNNYDINNLLKYRGEHTAIGLFFDKEDRLCGFAIAGIQKVRIDGKTHAIFSAGAYSDLEYSTGPEVARFALAQSFRYKLKHPTHKLAYLSEVLTPAAYSSLTRLLPVCYPHPHLKTPNYVESIIEAIKGYRPYLPIPNERFIVKFPLKRQIKNPDRLLHSTLRDKCGFYQYYLLYNTHFDEGAAVLTYVPLNLRNLVWGVINNGKAYLKRWTQRVTIIPRQTIKTS